MDLENPKDCMHMGNSLKKGYKVVRSKERSIFYQIKYPKRPSAAASKVGRGD